MWNSDAGQAGTALSPGVHREIPGVSQKMQAQDSVGLVPVVQGRTPRRNSGKADWCVGTMGICLGEPDGRSGNGG